MKVSKLRLVVALGRRLRISPMLCLVPGGSCVGGGRGREHEFCFLGKSRLWFVVALGGIHGISDTVCLVAGKSCVEGGWGALEVGGNSLWGDGGGEGGEGLSC